MGSTAGGGEPRSPDRESPDRESPDRDAPDRDAPEVAEERLLAEQLSYYRARAPEYDAWFRREGRHDRGPEATAAWFREVEQVRQALDALPLDGAEVLELAAGTGLWTEPLARRAAHVTAIDAAPEMIARNRERLGRLAARVIYREEDLFAWQPERTWDAVVFAFWISHVPAARLDGFLRTVARALRRGGALLFVDALREPSATARDDALPPAEQQVMLRHLDDGSAHRIVKNYWEPEELERRCRAAGLPVTVRRTPTYFLYGTAP